MTARIDSRNLKAGTKIWFNNGSWRKIVTVKMVRNGLVFYSWQERVNGEKVEKWDRLTEIAFLEKVIDGTEKAQGEAQHREYAPAAISTAAQDADYIAKSRKYS
jgi:hypothetical protein